MKNKKFLVTGLLVLAIISIIYIIKGIFPFGSDSIIWSDMHEQITAIYYHFYDAVRGNGSLLVDFTSGGGINFIGIMAYYILSPFTLILLLFPRDLLENAVSIVVALKILASSLTCLYFISKTFNKIKPSYQILLSVLYAFSSYTLSLYIITPWMDLVYLFPLLLLGLRKLLDLEDTKLYIIILSISLICCFYVSFMVLLFIIFSSLIYLLIYKKKNIKKAIFDLGVSTVISLLISSIVVIPSLLQISSSQRVGFDFNLVLNSKFGPLSDKISFLFGSAILISFILMLFLNYKKHKKFSLFLFLNLLLLGLPLLIEPINKMWHFGSYVYFPYRYGFILMFFLVIGACYYLNNVDISKKYSFKFSKVLPSIISVCFIATMSFVFIKYRVNIIEAIDHLTLTRDKVALFSLFAVFLVLIISSFVTIFTNKKNDKFTIIFLYILALSNILFNCYFYIGRYDPDNELASKYDMMLGMNQMKDITNNYYVKEVNRDLISNYGMVSNVNTYSNFTSLTDKTNYVTMQRLGYDSYWMDTQSIGGNLFTDVLLSQKYIVSKEEVKDSYYSYLNNEQGLNFYEFSLNMPYGYIVRENQTLEDAQNSFDASNIIYKSITGDENIFDIHSLFESDNDNSTYYKKGLITEQMLTITGKKRVYLDIFTAFDSSSKTNSYESFDVYVNDVLAYKDVPNDYRNGTLLLGEFTNQDVSIKVVSLKDTNVRNITIGVLDLDKVNSFINNNTIDINSVTFNDNSIKVSANGNEGDILFLPITYLEGYTSNTNDIIRVFDNFLGIRLHEGSNIVNISYIPPGFTVGIILSLLGVILFFFWTKYLYYMNFGFVYNAFYIIYLVLYAILILVFYVIMLLAFIKSFLF